MRYVLTPTPISIKLNRSDAVNSVLCLENKFDALWADAPDVDMTVETQLPQESQSEGEGTDHFAQRRMEKEEYRLEQNRHRSRRLKRQSWDKKVYEVLQYKKARKESLADTEAIQAAAQYRKLNSQELQAFLYWSTS